MAIIARTWSFTSQALANNAQVVLPALDNAQWWIRHVYAKMVSNAGVPFSGTVVIADATGLIVLQTLGYLSTSAATATTVEQDTLDTDVNWQSGFATGSQVRFQFNAAITELIVSGELL